jgi:CheY-like chemotaxis protein
MNSGPIILIDDDADDKAIFADVLKDLQIKNKLLWFDNCRSAFDYLKTTPEQPFVIVCDINMQVQNGLEFKRQIDADAHLRGKSIPFIFYSTSADPATVAAAYTELTVQGFFKKKTDYDQIKKEVKLILEYWSCCQHPNSTLR